MRLLSIRRCFSRRPRCRRPSPMTAPAEPGRDPAFMSAALVQARAAGASGEVPIGAVLVLGSYRLTDTTLYVTLEPCVMCAAAVVHARVRRLVFGAWDPRAGGAGSIVNVFALPGLNHRVDVFGGVLMEECAVLLQQFFAQRRA